MSNYRARIALRWLQYIFFEADTSDLRADTSDLQAGTSDQQADASDQQADASDLRAGTSDLQAGTFNSWKKILIMAKYGSVWRIYVEIKGCLRCQAKKFKFQNDSRELPNGSIKCTIDYWEFKCQATMSLR